MFKKLDENYEDVNSFVDVRMKIFFPADISGSVELPKYITD